MLPLRTYQILRAVLAYGTETAAGESLGLSQAAVNWHIRRAVKIVPELPFVLAHLRALHHQQKAAG